MNVKTFLKFGICIFVARNDVQKLNKGKKKPLQNNGLFQMSKVINEKRRISQPI
jgi:hypothetical protein